MALDDIIKQQKPRGARRGGSAASRFRKTNNQNQSQQTSSRGGFRNNRGGRASSNQSFKKKRNFVQVAQPQRDETSDEGVWKHDMFEQLQQQEQTQQNFQRRSANNNNNNAAGSGRKVVVENLEFSVSEQSLKSLFERVGTVSRVGINYDRSGRSLGKGFAIFETAEGASAAVKAYNGVELDGKPIKLMFPNSNRETRIVISSNRRGFQRRGRGGAGFRGRNKTITVDELNQQLDDYNMQI